MDFGELDLLLAQLLHAFLDPLRAALGNVDAVARPLAVAVIPLVAGLSLLRAGIGARMPAGSMFEVILICGLSLGALEAWPTIVDGTFDQVVVLAGLVPSSHSATDPFSLVSSGAVIANRAFDQAGSALSAIFSPIHAVLFALAGTVIFSTYLGASALMAMAYLELWTASVLTAPLLALLAVLGFTGAALVPVSFLVSSACRLAALSMVAGFAAELIAEHALPENGASWLHAYIAIALAVGMLVASWKLDKLVVGHILQGRPGFGAGLGAQWRMVTSSMAAGAGGGFTQAGAGAAAAGGGARSSGGGGGGSGGGGSTAGPGSTSIPTNSRSRP